MAHPSNLGAQRPPQVAASLAAAADLSLLDSVLFEIASLHRQSADLAAQTSARDRDDLTTVAQEFAAIHHRASKLLRGAAEQDQVHFPTPPPSRARSVAAGSSNATRRMLRAANELECRCAAISRQASDIGLEHLAEALVRWRRDLIGLERSARLAASGSAPTTAVSEKL